MRPLLALACLLLLTASLAGCSGDDPERFPNGGPTASSTSTGTNGGSASATGTASSTGTSTGAGNATGNGTGSRANHPPTGSINAAVNGTTVSFTLNATDADADALAWELDFGDGNRTNGTALPALVDHTFAVGNYTANFTVSDGNESASYQTDLAIANTVAAKQTQIVTGTAKIPNPAGDGFSCINGDVDGNIYDLDPAGPGWAYVLEPGDGSFGAYFYASGGAFISGGTAGSGEVPDGAVQIEVCSISGAPNTVYTVTLTEP